MKTATTAAAVVCAGYFCHRKNREKTEKNTKAVNDNDQATIGQGSVTVNVCVCRRTPKWQQ